MTEERWDALTGAGIDVATRWQFITGRGEPPDRVERVDRTFVRGSDDDRARVAEAVGVDVDQLLVYETGGLLG